MQLKKILITGGAGFVGSSLAILFKKHYEQVEVTAFDNLMRGGSELNIPLLKGNGVRFIHGDVRSREDLHALDAFDLLIDCSAEPSVHAGTKSSPRKVVDINFNGTLNCLEAARACGAAVLFLSTSRVYPIEALRKLDYTEGETRFELSDTQPLPGASAEGVAEEFPAEGARSFYGTTKLASEYLLQEYIYNYGMKGLINRCGLLTGPRQMGKVEQGVITLWIARHILGKPLRYIGFDGTGKQVRDLLHAEDLFELVNQQLRHLESWDGAVYNVGGGRDVSVSLLELTRLCREVTGSTVSITPEAETAAVDIPIYLSDCRKVREAFDWTPRKTAVQTVTDISDWIRQNRDALKTYF